MKIVILFIFAISLFANEVEDLLNAVKNNSKIESIEEQKRVERFKSDLDNQTKLLQLAKKELEELTNRSNQLNEKVAKNEKDLEVLETRLKEKSSILGEFFGVIKESVLEFEAHIDDSVISSEVKNRKNELKFVDRGNNLPKKEEIENYWKLLFEEMAKGGEISKNNLEVVDRSGDKQIRSVTRVGAFLLISDGKYLFSSGGNLYEYKTQPTSAKSYEDGSGFVELVIDPTRGDLFAILDKKIGFFERMKEGGVIGSFILLLGAIGLIVGGIRLVALRKEQKGVVAQQSNLLSLSSDNALGRVLLAKQKNLYNEAFAKEESSLEKGLGVIKLLAAVAPLLGLLGTVVGMIATFESIAIYGTNDPKLMANGISLALVTTMQGLLVAVPLLFVHSYLSSVMGDILDIVEQESATND